MNDHRAIMNRLDWMQATYRLGPDDRVLQKTPTSFDVSVWELFWPLITGARLVIAAPGGHQDPGYLVRTVREQGVTTMHFVPSMLGVFLDQPGVGECRSLKRVIASGEALSFDLKERFFSRLPGVELHNLYGPTEAAVDVTAWRCGRGGRSTVPIGRPITNVRIHLLDRQLRPVAIGVAGELVIGGVQVGRGYLSRPALTAERFVPDPFGDDGGRLYRTGDLARHRSDGAVEFLGRLDHQVKVHGLRIELGEIEAALAAHGGVAEAVVLARAEGDDLRLVAYLVPAGDSSQLVSQLRRDLGARLPQYMVPAAFVVLDRLPLLPNGKLDRRALARLPIPELGAAAGGRYLEPADERERTLAAIWAEVLGVGRVGVEDDFFELGGDSFHAIRAVQKIGQGLGVLDLLKSPTVRQLARQLAAGEKREHGLLQRLTPARGEDGTATLVCVPYGGAGALVYRPLAAALPAGWTLWSVALPGHDVGDGEDQLRPIDQVAERAVEEIRQLRRGPLYLYGHCVGVALTLELARRLEAAGIGVDGVFLGAALPMLYGRLSGKIVRWRMRRQVATDDKVAEFLRFLGVGAEVVAGEFLLRAFRHDALAAIDYFEQIQRRGWLQPLTAPLVALIGDRDPLTRDYATRAGQWQFFGPRFTLSIIPGGAHYFVKEQAAEVAGVIIQSSAP